MSRNLVICCDGTSNEVERDPTNVLKLAYAATKDPKTQLLFYNPGVGTMEPPGLQTRTGKWLSRLAGLAFGAGLKDDIRDVYTFIIDHYEPGDDLYIFGFSRGAYTARAVVALIHAYGLLAPGNGALVPYAIRLLWDFHRKRGDALQECFRLAAQFRETLSIGTCRLRFLGVWDTVSSVGWIANPLSLPYTRQLPDVEIIRHAVAIDERRAFFRTNLVEQKAGRDIEEVWFPGDHCDVGGGHAESESGLSKLSLEWMIAEAANAGMKFEQDRVDEVLGRTTSRYSRPDPNARAHDALWPVWWIAELFPKKHWNKDRQRNELRPNWFKRRTWSARPRVDDSAWLRGDDYVKKLPKHAVRRSQLGSARRSDAIREA